jgi:hypothetical protein
MNASGSRHARTLHIIVSLLCRDQKKHNPSREIEGNRRGQSQKTRMDFWAGSQRLIPTGERSGLQTLIATESVSLCPAVRN